MLRKTLISMAVSSLLYASSSQALELGELTSNSNVDEPYRGQIVISDAAGLTSNDILVRLGSESEFRQAGLAPTRILSELKFDVTQANGRLVVQVSSDAPLQAEELHFVLAARWPSGQVVREYLTPLQQSARVEKSQSEVVQAASLAGATGATNSVFRDAVSSANQLPIRAELDVVKGNTLWSIANQNRQGNQLTIYQTMMAIQALNQEAFYANNINLLKEGAILRLPTEDQIALFNQSMSQQEFERQHQAWMALKSNSASRGVEQAQLNTQAQSKNAAASNASASDKLTLASGQSVLPQSNASSNGGGGQDVAELKNQLSASQELLDKEQREKAELSDKLGDLNQQLATLEQLISLKDKQMAELQLQFSQAQQALQEQKNTVDQLLEADQMRREKELAEENSLFNKIFGNSIIVSIGAVVLMLLGFLGGMLLRKGGKKKEDERATDEFDLASGAALATVAAAPVVAAVAEEEPEPVVEEDPFAFDFNDNSELSDDLDTFEEESFEVEETELADEFEFPEDDEPEVELAPEAEELEDDFAEIDFEDEDETIEEESVPTVDPIEDISDELDGLDDLDEEEISEEESFVSSLLNDVEQDDVDESAVFDQDPNEALANSIEETLAEAQEEIEAPSFGVEDAIEDEVESDDEEEFDFFDASGDEVATKLDLARAYMDMGDDEGARVIFEDVAKTGNEQQVAEAKSMMERMFPSD
ncbi:FimV/HubP family polar landmark protein [Marinomonas dokdonensis]|uniref:FimV/HubP family polar landmark protein n=1 Tax=Marinomonas dokdonensis TaxID=328224 RepID=UPI004055707F